MKGVKNKNSDSKIDNVNFKKKSKKKLSKFKKNIGQDSLNKKSSKLKLRHNPRGVSINDKTSLSKNISRQIDNSSNISKKDGMKKVLQKKEKSVKNKSFSMVDLANSLKKEQISEQRSHIKKVLDSEFHSKKVLSKNEIAHKDIASKNNLFIKTGIEGLDELFEKGIPQGNSIIVAGGAGSGKTILCLQMLYYHALAGRKCLYMSFEESEDRLVKHMEGFGWDVKKFIKKGKVKIQRMNPFDITRNVDALLAKQKGELLIEVDPLITPKNFDKPDIIIIDSLTSIGSAFTSKEESYRIYIEQLFRFLEKTGATSFLITETEQIPKIFSSSGVEEFLADGVIVLYNLKHENVRENAIEILKLRGAAHKKNLVAMEITAQGIVVYPEQEVFSDID